MSRTLIQLSIVIAVLGLNSAALAQQSAAWHAKGAALAVLTPSAADNSPKTSTATETPIPANPPSLKGARIGLGLSITAMALGTGLAVVGPAIGAIDSETSNSGAAAMIGLGVLIGAGGLIGTIMSARSLRRKKRDRRAFEAGYAQQPQPGVDGGGVAPPGAVQHADLRGQASPVREADPALNRTPPASPRSGNE